MPVEQLPSVGLGTNFDPTNFDPHDICRELTVDIDLLGLKLVLPINVDIQIPYDGIPNPGDVTGRLMAYLNTVLAPLSPFFDVVDLILALPDLFDAIKSLNPFKIGDVLGSLSVRFTNLAKLLPQLALPRSIKSFLRVLIRFLQALRADILLILAEQSRIDLTAQRALTIGAPDLSVSVGCMQVDLNARIDVLRNNAQPVNRLILSVNLFCNLAGLPEIPAVTIGPDLEAALGPLDDTIALLAEMDAALKVPI